MGSSVEDGVAETKEPVQSPFKPAISKELSVVTIEDRPKWVEELVEYSKKGTLLGDKKKAIQLRTKAARFTMVNGTLYKRGFMLPFSNVSLRSKVITF